MDQFERQFEHLDVQTQSMEEAMSGVTTLSTPEVSLFVLGLIYELICIVSTDIRIICHVIVSDLIVHFYQDQVTSLMQQASDEAG